MGKLINKGKSSFKVITLYQNIIEYTEINCSEILAICHSGVVRVAGSNPVVPTFFRYQKNRLCSLLNKHNPLNQRNY